MKVLLFNVAIFLVLCSFIYPQQRRYLDINFKKWSITNQCVKREWFDYPDKSYGTCNAKPIDDCYLQTNDLSTNSANRLVLEVTTITLSCFGRNLTYPKCRDNFTMQIYKGDSATAASESLLPKINQTEVLKEIEFNTTDIFAFDGMDSVDKINIRFYANLFCGKFEKVQMYYFECPTATGDLVEFPSAIAPDKNEFERKIVGRCTENAALNGAETPYMTCKYDGTYRPIGSCSCKKGYTKSNTNCVECPSGQYKPDPGNQACLFCGMNSKDGSAPRETCECKTGYHKAIGSKNEFQADCYAPPAAPTKVVVTNIKPHEAEIQWKASSPGTSILGTYWLECKNCPKSLGYFPKLTNQTTINVKDLGAFATYQIEISNKNNITKLTGEWNFAPINFTTLQGAPGPISFPLTETDDDGSVVFHWEPPFAIGGNNPMYIVKYGDERLELTTRTFKIKSDLQVRTYTVSIVTEVTVNGKKLSGEEYVKTVTVQGGIPFSLALGMAFGIVIFIAVVLITAFCVWKRRNPAYLQVVRMEDGSVKLPARFYTGGKIYVDPKSYPDVDEAVNEFAYEINRNNLKIKEKIGEGEFSDVYKGELSRDGKNNTVAVKILKPGATRHDRDDFLSEAAIVGQFSDPNVIMLEGVILKDDPNAIILEFMVHGALDKFLQGHDMQFTATELLYMARGIASGMKYLSEMGFIHRDLAARNILVNEQKICKIADFGMSLEIKMEDGTESKGGKIPVRWTAPEAIQFKKFTTASDVWSYGILLWEIMSYGERPYWEWSNYEVLEQVSRAYRLPPPMGCPRVVHDLMLNCWNKERTKRPLFSIIRDRIDMWLDNPRLLDEEATMTKLDDNLDYTIMQTINKWLQAIGMGRYANDFIEQGFATPRQILLLTMKDLEALGIGQVDHQQRIYKAIQNTRAQVEAQMKRTGSVVSNKNIKDDNLETFNFEL